MQMHKWTPKEVSFLVLGWNPLLMALTLHVDYNNRVRWNEVLLTSFQQVGISGLILRRFASLKASRASACKYKSDA